MGIALAQPERKVVCIDGDGAFLMHMGSLATIGNSLPSNYYHILLNNFVHESVGGQKTSIDSVDVLGVVKSANIKNVISVNNDRDLKNNIEEFFSNSGPKFMEIKLKPGSRDDLGRPTIKPVDNKQNLIDFLKK